MPLISGIARRGLPCMMSNGDIFFYTHYKVSKKSIIIQIDIELSSSSHSDVAAPPLPDISVYPNPAQMSRASLK